MDKESTRGVALPVSGTRIGRITSRPEDPETWEGWLENDEQVIPVLGDGNLHWVTYLVVREYQGRLIQDLHLLAPRVRDREGRKDFRDLVQIVHECSNFMEQKLREHFDEVRAEITARL